MSATSHPHMIATHPFLPVFYLPDLGEDKLRVYNIGENDQLSNLTEYQQPYGAGPRHLAITSSGQYLYLLHELSANIRPHAIDQTTGELSQIQDEQVQVQDMADISQPIYPSNATFSTDLSAAEVHVSNDGRFLYASNRNLTAATSIQEGDVSTILSCQLISAIRYTSRLVDRQQRDHHSHSIRHGFRSSANSSHGALACQYHCFSRRARLHCSWRSPDREYVHIQAGQTEWNARTSCADEGDFSTSNVSVAIRVELEKETIAERNDIIVSDTLRNVQEDPLSDYRYTSLP